MDPLKVSDSIALIDTEGSRHWTYRDLAEHTQKFEQAIGSERCLVLIRCRNHPDTIAAYLACLNRGHVALLLDDKLRPDAIAAIVDRYQPQVICSPEKAVSQVPGSPDVKLHPDLAVLLPTSGSTGSPKLVRLSQKNLQANADSIISYLSIDAAERAPMTMPMSYSYGLSILNSHLGAGASVVLCSQSFIEKDYWGIFAESEATSLSGVPLQYQMLRRVGFDKLDLPSLKTMTQAGGRLDPKLVTYFAEHCRERGRRFFVMYGQTEATARMTYLDPEVVLAKPGSVGRAIPGGRLSIDDGEVVYHGPNVMLGYAEGPADLSLGDHSNGQLRTGDLGYLDEDGDLFITGRSRRIAKVFGLRVNLDEVEASCRIPCAALAAGEGIVLFCEGAESADHEVARQELAQRFGININGFRVREVTELPRTSSSKVDYRALESQL